MGNESVNSDLESRKRQLKVYCLQNINRLHDLNFFLLPSKEQLLSTDSTKSKKLKDVCD